MKQSSGAPQQTRKENLTMNKNYEFALTAVLNDIGMNRADARLVNIEKQDGLYYVSFRTDWQKYEAYVDAESFQVMGLNFMPAGEVCMDEIDYIVASVVA